MKTIKNLLLMTFSAATLLISGCSKEDDTGPAGPQGPAGADGAGNVKSIEFLALPSEWTTFGTAGNIGHAKILEEPIPEITSDVVDNGGVCGFIKQGTFWYALPYTIYNPGAQGYMHPSFKEGIFKLEFQLSTLQTPTVGSSYEFKVLIVDGTARTMNPDLNWKDYNQVAERFDLN